MHPSEQTPILTPSYETILGPNPDILGGGGGGGGGGALPIMTYKGRLYLKGAPFSGFRSMKGWGFHWLKG